MMSILRFAVLLTLASLALTPPASAAEKLKVGVLRFVSSGGLFLAAERGYFKDQDLDVELVFFDAAQPIAVAVTSGDIDVGVTAITGGTLNLAGKGAITMIASQGAEKKGFKGNALIVSSAAYARGLTSLDKLPGASIAITQVGSSHHYMMGQIAARYHFDLDKVDLKPLQSIPNMVAAVRSGQVDGALMTPQFAKPVIDAGEGKLIAYFSDLADYQYGAVFTSPKMVAERRALLQKFVDAYRKGNADYGKALLRTDASEAPVVDEAARQAASIIAKSTNPGQPAEKAVATILASIVYVDASAKIDLKGIEEQVAWYQSQKLVSPGVDAKAFVDPSFTP